MDEQVSTKALLANGERAAVEAEQRAARDKVYDVIAAVRDAHPRVHNDASTDDLLDALLDNDALVMDFLAQAQRGPTF